MSRRDRRQPSASFLKDRTGVALARLCVETRNEKLFARFIASIPYADDSVNYSSNLNGKQKEKFKIKDGRTRSEHRLTDEDTNKIKNNNRVDSACKRQESSDSKQEKTKIITNSKMERCIFCQVERVRINDHYLTKHKIDFPLWLKKQSEKGKQYNDTTCRQCEVDYEDDYNFKKHITEYHNVNLRMNAMKCAKARKSKYNFDKMPTFNNKHLIKGSQEFESKQKREHFEKESYPQDRNIVKPTTQNERRKGRQDEMEVEVPKITRFCVLCGEYVEVFAFEEHVADHRRGKTAFPFKTTANSTQGTANEQELRDIQTTNYGSSIGGEVELATTQNTQKGSVENANPGPSNSEQDHITESGDGAEEAEARVMYNEERMRGVEVKWLCEGYYQKMLLEKDEGRRKMLYKKFLHLKKTMNSTLPNKNKGTLSISTC